MRKINWFSRLFMGWDSLVEHIGNNSNQTNEELIKLRTENEFLNKNVEELKGFLEANTNNLNTKQSEIASIVDKLAKAEAEREAMRGTNASQSEELAVKRTQIESLKDSLNENKNNLDLLKKEINEKLSPLKRIQKTFFAEAGNKGKGELGEMQVKSILQKSGLEENLWTENLIVSGKQVEFAIKSGEDDKWIPVDSKVLDTEVNDEGKIVIDKNYSSRVKTQVKEITKYLGKANTADYGLLVLQNDSIYMELFNNEPSLFQEMIRKHKVYVCSPSSFVQFAWSVSHIIDIYEQVHNDEKIYEQMMGALTTITKLSNSLVKVHKDFNTAMNTHYPTLQKRQIKLQNKLNKDGKIKELPAIELSE